ncbi:MAG: ribosome biogenesis protein [Nitrosopumilus sp. B06]|nr:MAG: ribosome biogenesis protein [Nitrosopumilus sp. D6]RNJ79882.1 MAG: ribosome biogenesis protein [Nitrosopumilus sp. B06]
MITLILAESSLELVPPDLARHPSITSHAQKLGRDASEILLDNSWHFAAMKGLRNEIKRGRPDLVHHSVLEAVSTPLYRRDGLNLFVHTIHDKVIRLGLQVRVPRSYHRFAGLVEKLYREGRVSAGDVLLEISDMTLSGILDEISPSAVIGLSSRGTPSSYAKVAADLPDGACIIVGGFQKGGFSEKTSGLLDSAYSVEDMPLEGHVVISRMLYEYEKTIFM